MLKTYTRIAIMLMVLVGSGFVTRVGAQTFANFTINQPAPPGAAFSYTNSGLDYTFSDLSTGSVASWMWDFGDGNTSTQQSPSHLYSNDGSIVVCLTVTDSNNCTSSTCDTILLVGFNDHEDLAGLEVSPNPFEGETQISYDLPIRATVQMNIVDLNGKLVRRYDAVEQAAGSHTLRFGKELPAGVYLLQLNVDGERFVERIVKQKF